MLSAARSVIAAVAAMAAWVWHHPITAAAVLLAVGVGVLALAAIPDDPQPNADPKPEAEADFDAHPDAAELEALFAAVLADHTPPDQPDPRPHLP